MDNRTITITVKPIGSARCTVDVTLSAPHRGTRGLRQVRLYGTHRATMAPYVSELTEGLAKELATAVQLVLAGYYEEQQLPF